MTIIREAVLSVLLMLSSCAFSQMVTDTSDLGVTAAVNNRLAANPLLTATHIEVSATNGVVNLAGKVKNDTQSTIAVEITQATPGVKDVDTSQLGVENGNQPPADALITAKIKGLFLQQGLIGEMETSALKIKVETSDGIVSLSGTAKNQGQINAAIKLAQSISGVRQVKSLLQVFATNQHSPSSDPTRRE